MSKTKRLEKEIDYLKTMIGILVALCAGLTTWFVKEETTSAVLQAIGVCLFLVFLYVIIKSHIKIKLLLDKLEEEHE